MHRNAGRSRLLRRRARLCLFAGVLLAAPALRAQAPDAGRVKIVSGAVFIVREQKAIPASAGTPILALDSLRTGDDGHVGVTLKDGTRISLGPRTEVRISEFVYSPGEGRLAFVMGVVRGVAAYVSGQIARLSPDAVRVETPDAIIGVRGTEIAIRVEER